MSELRVWVDGKERVIRGVSADTTCENILIALAKAAGKSGRVALLEKWRDLERILPRSEKPIKCLQMWGNLQCEVRFYLRDETASQSIADVEKCPAIDSVIDNDSSDPRSLDCKSLEALAANQASKISRLARASEILDSQLACWTDNEEASLYYTEKEINEDLASKLTEILKLQERELSGFQSDKRELDKLKERQKKLTTNIEFFRENVSSVEARIMDLESTGEKLFSQLQNHNSVGEFCEGCEKSKQQVDSVMEANELRAIRLELNKQKALSDRQSLELENVSRSVLEISKSVAQRTTNVAALESELDARDVYYDLDEDFQTTSPEKYEELDNPLESKNTKRNVGFIAREKTSKQECPLINGNGFDKLSLHSSSDQEYHLTTNLQTEDHNIASRHLQTKRGTPLNGISQGKYINCGNSTDSRQKVDYVNGSLAASTSYPITTQSGSSRNIKYLHPPAAKHKDHHKHKRVPIIENDLCDQGVFV